MNKIPSYRVTHSLTPGMYIPVRNNSISAAAPPTGALTMFQRLLLVEDSHPMRDAVEQILGDQFGSIHWVGDGSEVITEAAKVMPHIIILDISLPGISGLILLPLLREAHPQTTIVMLTNHADDLYRRQAFARGADAYVSKSRANQDLVPAIWTGRRQIPFTDSATAHHVLD